MQQFSNYYQPNIQMLNNQEITLQRQINNLQSQLQQTQALQNQMAQMQQSANMQTIQAMQQPMPQNNNQMGGISTNIVEDFANISIDSIPMDNNGAFFVKRDGSEIQLKRWNGNGQIVTTSYLPIIDSEANDSMPNENKSQITISDEATEAFQRHFAEIADRLDTIENTLSNFKQQKAVGRPAKKEAVENANANEQ